jgi:hypothetical protein
MIEGELMKLQQLLVFRSDVPFTKEELIKITAQLEIELTNANSIELKSWKSNNYDISVQYTSSEKSIFHLNVLAQSYGIISAVHRQQVNGLLSAVAVLMGPAPDTLLETIASHVEQAKENKDGQPV